MRRRSTNRSRDRLRVVRPERWRGSERFVSGVSVGVSSQPNEDSSVGSSRALFRLRRSHHDRRRQLDRRGVCAGVACSYSRGAGEGTRNGALRSGDGRRCAQRSAGRTALTDASSFGAESDRAPRHATVRASDAAQSKGNAAGSADDVSASAGNGNAGGELDATASGECSPASGVRATTDGAARSTGSTDAVDACGSSASERSGASVRRPDARAGSGAARIPRSASDTSNADSDADQPILGQ